MQNLLDLLRSNPYGWGNIPGAQKGPEAYQVADEWGQQHHGVTGNPLYGPDPTLRENLMSLGELPARTVSPYNFDTGEMQVPPMLSEPVNALSRVASSGGLPDPQDTQNQHDISTLLMTMFGGNAMSPARAGEAGAMRALSDTSGPAFNAVDHPINLFHGTAGPVDRFNTRDLWASPSEHTAGRYADQAAAKTGSDKNIIPMELHSDKIMTPTQRWMDANTARQQALDGGYDAINWGPFEAGGGDYYQVVRPNTVRHAETGQTLFSDTGKPSQLGAALAGAQDADPESHAAIMDLLKKYGVTP